MSRELAINRHIRAAADILRVQVEAQEDGWQYSAMMHGMFCQDGDRGAVLHQRKEWARLLAVLYPLERYIDRLDDKWWGGPYTEKPREKCDDGGMGYMMSCMRDGDQAVHARWTKSVARWKKNKGRPDWSRRQDARAQIKNPNRQLRIEVTK